MCVSRTYFTQLTVRSRTSGTQTFLQILIGGHWTFSVWQQPGLYTQRQQQGSHVQQPGDCTVRQTTGPGHSLTCVSQ